MDVHGEVTITGTLFNVDGTNYTGTYTDTWVVGVVHIVSVPFLGPYTAVVSYVAASLPQTTVIDGSSPCYQFTNAGDWGFCASLPPIPLMQLEYGCVIPAIVNTYAYVIGIEWLVGIIAAVISGMVYLKTESTWLVLVLNVCLMPVCAFLLPAQLSGLIYDVFVLAIAGMAYLLVRG